MKEIEQWKRESDFLKRELEQVKRENHKRVSINWYVLQSTVGGQSPRDIMVIIVYVLLIS